MAYVSHLNELGRGVDVWNSWRQDNAETQPDLSWADLSGKNLFGADLSGANLTGTTLSEANLSTANLRRALFTGANLRDANLGGADLRSAHLTYADLENADLHGADLGIEPEESPNTEVAPRQTSVAQRREQRREFRGADLTGTNLRGADLRQADLNGTTLAESDLQNANLNNTVLAADLTKANLRGASLIGAEILDVPFDGPFAMFDSAIYDVHTKWPDAFNPAVRTFADFIPDDEEQPASLRDIAETLAAYVGLPAVLLYPLGLFMLALQLHYDDRIGLDFVDAWYASSLVSHVVIAGQGARAFLMPLLISATISLVIARLLFARPEPETTRTMGRTYRPLIVPLVLITVGLVGLLSVPFFVLVKIFHWGTGFIVGLSILGGIVGGQLVYLNHRRSRYRRALNLWKGVPQGWAMLGLTIAYGVGLVAVFATAFWVQSKTLPEVRIPDNDGTISDEPDGWLLSHDLGYWHIVTTQPSQKGSGFDVGDSGGEEARELGAGSGLNSIPRASVTFRTVGA